MITVLLRPFCSMLSADREGATNNQRGETAEPFLSSSPAVLWTGMPNLDHRPSRLIRTPICAVTHNRLVGREEGGGRHLRSDFLFVRRDTLPIQYVKRLGKQQPSALELGQKRSPPNTDQALPFWVCVCVCVSLSCLSGARALSLSLPARGAASLLRTCTLGIHETSTVCLASYTR